MTLSVQKPPRVKLVAAIMAVDEKLIADSIAALSPLYGPVERSSVVFPFAYSGYYAKEMGSDLVKIFCAFRNLIEQEEIVARKLEAIECERCFLRSGTMARTANVDPGYLDRMKLVLATTKNASHRVCIGSGIYGEVELMYRSGAFVPLEWTYPDYREPLALEFFGRVRKEYLAQLRSGGQENTPSA
jgi:hypothetical protein